MHRGRVCGAVAAGKGAPIGMDSLVRRLSWQTEDSDRPKLDATDGDRDQEQGQSGEEGADEDGDDEEHKELALGPVCVAEAKAQRGAGVRRGPGHVGMTSAGAGKRVADCDLTFVLRFYLFLSFDRTRAVMSCESPFRLSSPFRLVSLPTRTVIIVEQSTERVDHSTAAD